MTGSSSSTSSSTLSDKPSSTINIKHVVPLILDLDRMNYDIWRELFEIHCIGYGVKDHLEPPKEKIYAENNDEWTRLDAIVKSWMYGTLEISLLHLIFEKQTTAYDVWLKLEKKFRTNKANKVIQLDNELRNITIGTSSVTEYCNRIKNLADLLNNMDAKVPEPNLVAYTLNGLSPKFRVFATTIRHRDPLPSFWDVKSMLIQEEQQFIQEDSRRSSLTHSDTASSPHALATESTNQPPSRGGHRGGRNAGRYRGGRNGRHAGRNFNGGSEPPVNGPYQQRGVGNSSGNWVYGWHQVNNNGGVKSSNGGPNSLGLLPSPNSAPHNNHFGPRQPWVQPNTAQQHLFFGPQQAYQTSHTSQPFLWPNNSYSTNPEPTSLPQMFNTMSLNDPGQDGWYMDTGATSHVHANVGSSNQTNSHAM
ncbi:hypothetical protein Lser_V15G25908 [Lactuca serriola]